MVESPLRSLEEIVSAIYHEAERPVFAGCNESKLSSVFEREAAIRDVLVRSGCQRVALISDSYLLVLAGLIGAMRSGASLALIAPQTPPKLLMDQVRSFQPDLLLTDADRGEPTLPGGLTLATASRSCPWPEAVAYGHFESASRVTELGSGACVVLFTSGTSGKPKMVAHSPESLLAAYRLVRSLRLELYDDQADANRDDLDLFGTRAQFGAPMTYLSAMPAATISGLSLGLQALLGGEMIVERPMYDADQILCSIRRLSVTSIGLPPVVALAMARGQRKKAHNIETLLVLGMGGNPVAPELHGPLEELFECRVMTGYGSTELGGAVMATRFLDQPAPWSVGRPVPGVKAAQDPGSGELLIQSPAMAMGYMNDQGVVEPFPLDTGWFRTGDALSWDAFTETYSYEHRLSEEIVRGGRKIHPEDIERVLLDCEGVAEAVVVGVPSRLVGEEDVVAAIVLKFPIAIAELRHRCIDRLGTTWCPRSIRTMDRIPRLASGKPNRQQIRDSLAIER